MVYSGYSKEYNRKEVIPIEKKLRYSPQRERILEYLTATPLHPTAEMVYHDLKPELPGLSLGTVYRNLNLLEALGKVRRVISFQGSERYDACCDDHAHFLCERCGTLHDMHNAELDPIRGAISLGEGYRLNKLNLTVLGICPDCAGSCHPVRPVS